jgi:hypothetical protein
MVRRTDIDILDKKYYNKTMDKMECLEELEHVTLNPAEIAGEYTQFKRKPETDLGLVLRCKAIRDHAGFIVGSDGTTPEPRPLTAVDQAVIRYFESISETLARAGKRSVPFFDILQDFLGQEAFASIADTQHLDDKQRSAFVRDIMEVLLTSAEREIVLKKTGIDEWHLDASEAPLSQQFEVDDIADEVEAALKQVFPQL